MAKYYRSGIFFIFIFFLPAFAFCDSEDSYELEQIVVTKSKVWPLGSYSAGAEQLKSLPVVSVFESLKYLPVDLQARQLKSGIQSDISLRGSTFQGVLILFNGQRINDPQTAHHNQDIPLTKEDIESIDVIPGISSSVFGPDAIGGAVNILTKKPQERKMVLEAAAGNYKSGRALFSVSDKINNLGLRFSLERSESGGYRYDTDFKKFISNIASCVDLPDGDFHLNYGYLENEFGAYDFYTPASGYASKEWTKTYLLDSGLELNKNGFFIKPNFIFRRHYDKFMLDKTLERSRYLNHHRADTYTPGIYFQKEIQALGKLGSGIEYGREKINSTNLGKHNRKHNSLYLDDSQDLTERLSLGSSFRIDDYDSFKRIYTGSAVLKYEVAKDQTLGFGIARSTRVPSFTEIYYNDPTTLGNTGLSAEKSLSYQLDYNKNKEPFIFTGSLFLRKEEDMIDWVKREPTQVKFQAENITRDYVLGAETRFKLKVNDFFCFDSNYTYINKRIDEQGLTYKYGQNYAKHLINTLFSFKLPFGAQTVGLSYKRKPHRRGWVSMDSHFSYKFIFLNITNFLNVEYQEIAGIPSAPRSLEAGLRLEW